MPVSLPQPSKNNHQAEIAGRWCKDWRSVVIAGLAFLVWREVVVGRATVGIFQVQPQNDDASSFERDLAVNSLVEAPEKEEEPIITSTNTRTTTQSKLNHSLCSQFTTPSTSLLWKQLKNETLLASYFPDTQNLSKEPKFREWVDQLFSFYTPERLRQSIATRASSSAMRRVIQILSDYPTTKEPLRILVSGGSVTAGHSCGATPHGVPGGSAGNNPWEPCSWPVRLEHLWNQILFGGEERIQITNMASGGINSDMAALVFKYHLFRKEQPLPHIILLAHSANDAFSDNTGYQIMYQHMQDIVHSAHKMRDCDRDLPLVVMVDDLYGTNNPFVALEQTARFYSLASWFRLMSISYSNVARNEVYSRYVNASLEDPLMGNKFDIHFGMGFHIGMGWTVMYNFLNELVETCYEDQQDGGLTTSDAVADWWPNKTDILELDKLNKRGAPSKSIGFLRKNSTVGSIASEWKERARSRESRCQGVNESSDPGRPCEYAWMFNRNSKVVYSEDIDREMKDVLAHNDGWVAKGHADTKNKTGWYAMKHNATFSLKILVSKVEPSYFTIVIMQSYGPSFVGTNLAMDLRVQHAAGGNDDQTSYQVSGYHKLKTSVHVPHKFLIPGGRAAVGDTIYLDATLTSGAHFKVSGLLFCKY
jgi:hypothetical protein